MAKELRTFVLVHKGKVISPPLVTIREYAAWMEKYFDEYTCHIELYLPAKKDGITVWEWHPGTKLGTFFDHKCRNLKSWQIQNDTNIMGQLIRHGFATSTDCHTRKLRLYTVRQIEVYIKTVIDHSFELGTKIIDPIQITVTEADMQGVIQPKQRKSKFLLF